MNANFSINSSRAGYGNPCAPLLVFMRSREFQTSLPIPFAILNRHESFDFIGSLFRQVAIFKRVGLEIVEFDFGRDGVERTGGFGWTRDDEFRKTINHHARIQTLAGIFEVGDVVTVRLHENGFAFRHGIAIQQVQLRNVGWSFDLGDFKNGRCISALHKFRTFDEAAEFFFCHIMQSAFNGFWVRGFLVTDREPLPDDDP